MRWPLFVFAAILMTAGVLLAIVYPRVMEDAPGHEIDRRTVFAGGDEFVVMDATLWPSDGPTVITVELFIKGPLRSGAEPEVLTVAALDDRGREAARVSLGFPTPGTLESPQTGIMRYRETVRLLEPATGPHSFVVAAGRDFSDSVLIVELALNAGTYHVQPNARPVGLALMAAGALGLLISLRRRRENPNSQPPPSKWGRG